MNQQWVYTADEFDAESRYIETLIWEAVVVEPESKVLCCGYGPDGTAVQHAIKAGAHVTVIEHRNEAITRFSKLDAKLLRGSTSVIPAKDNSFDLAISFHYLHEIDPFFHAQVLSELARVARRIAVVEPSPPADPLGKRIAVLYSQAKRELGQFEYYQPLEYWKKLLQAVKADVSQHVFAFAKVPPREYLVDTVALLLDTIEIEDAPRQYMDELRQIAGRSDAALLPPPRFVLVGAAAGELILPHFTQRLPEPVAVIAPRTVSSEAGYEFPPVEPVRAISPPETIIAAPESAPAPPPAPMPAVTGFGVPANEPAPVFGVSLPFGVPPPPTPAPESPPPPPGMPFGMPFAVPGDASDSAFGLPPEGVPPSSTWQWEPPDGGRGQPVP